MHKFYEQFITKDYGIAPKIMRGLFWASSGLSFLFFASLALVPAIFFVISFIGIELIIRNIFLEYEYEYFEGELTISKIMDKRRRKIIGRFTTEQISKVSKPESLDKDNKIINACLKNIPNNKELIIFTGGGNESKGYYLSIDENLFEILKRDKPYIFNHIV